jgi:hypothetical protein
MRTRIVACDNTSLAELWQSTKRRIPCISTATAAEKDPNRVLSSCERRTKSMLMASYLGGSWNFDINEALLYAKSMVGVGLVSPLTSSRQKSRG